jgi:hypothetical protein
LLFGIIASDRRAAEDRGAAEDDGRDCEELVAGACVGLCLAEVGDINEGGEARDRSGQNVHEREPSFDGNAGMAGAFG